MKYFYKIINILFLFALLILLFIFLKQLNIISINNLSNTNIVNIKINDIEYKEIHKDLVILQVSITFLTTAILSLISSLENKKY